MAYYHNQDKDNSVNAVFTDWKPFIDNTQNALDEIEKLAATCYIEIENINLFYARLKSYLSTRWSYIRDEKENDIKNKLANISNTLFSKSYITELNKRINDKNYSNISFIQTQAKILDDLFNIMDLMSKEFKRFKLIYSPEEYRDDFDDVEEGALKEAMKGFKMIIENK